MTLVAEENRIHVGQLTKGRTVETLRVKIPTAKTYNMGEVVKIATPANGTNIAVIADLDVVANAAGVMAGYYDTTADASGCEGIIIVVAPFGLEKKYITTPVGTVSQIKIPNVPFTDTTNVQGELA